MPVETGADAVDAPTSVIRQYEVRDAKELQILMGMRVFEQLPRANNQAYLNSFTLAIWLGLSSIIIRYFDWMPRNNIDIIPYVGYFAPMPAFGMVGVPLLFIIDWLQRPYFERQLREELTSEDILHLPAYYHTSSSSPYSRFTILEWKKRPIGFIAIDASAPDTQLTSLESRGVLGRKGEKKSSVQDTPRRSGRLQSKSQSRIAADAPPDALTVRSAHIPPADLPSYAMIRHFHVDRVYQPAGVQYDLVRAAVGEIFASSPTSSSSEKGQSKKAAKYQSISRILVRLSSLEPEAEKTFRRIGFVDCMDPERRGKRRVAKSYVLFGEWEFWLEITRERWAKVEGTAWTEQ